MPGKLNYFYCTCSFFLCFHAVSKNIFSSLIFLLQQYYQFIVKLYKYFHVLNNLIILLLEIKNLTEIFLESTMLLCIWTTVIIIIIIIYFCLWDNQCCVMSDIVIWCNILIQYLFMCSLFSMLLCFGLLSLHLILNLISFLCVLWSCRRDVLQEIVEMQNYEGVFLPVALRWALTVIHIFLWKGFVDGSFLCSVTEKKDYQCLKVQCSQQK